MATGIDYGKARKLLEDRFSIAETNVLKKCAPTAEKSVALASDTLFTSSTQAFREVLLGCAMARIQNKSINIRQPYSDQGPNAFSGRTLDEKVVNPFLHDKRIPSSKGPYLSVFRRSVQFDKKTRQGLRDQHAYDSFLKLIAYLESASEQPELLNFLDYLLCKFVELREASVVPISRLQRISLEQYDLLLSGLLSTPSGGKLPVLLVVATFTSIKQFFGVNWDITWQGINVADTASGAGGDITISNAGKALMVAEVTERPLEKSRVVSTFNTKIAPNAIEDYLFFVKTAASTEARQLAHQYFAQGHEVNFLEIKNWILMSLATMGSRGRVIFNKELVNLLDAPDVSRTLKMAWNDQISRLTSQK